MSFPPEASSWWSVLHLSPHTSCLCPWRRRSDWRGGARVSRCRITRSRLPDDSWSAFHASAPGDGEARQSQLWFAGPRCTLTKLLMCHSRNRLSNLHTHPLELCGLQAQRASFPLLHPIFVHSLYVSPRPPGFPNNREHTLNIAPPKEKPARTGIGFWMQAYI